ncbi:MAG: hypothetical protein H7A25_22660 [Leptospiraceae bacterium]|nr:hypothetical protein [Leptospiraceae bacterium]MCP5502718.1 hypothetical protein [Leptospiraceae bacterium]
MPQIDYVALYKQVDEIIFDIQFSNMMGALIMTMVPTLFIAVMSFIKRKQMKLYHIFIYAPPVLIIAFMSFQSVMNSSAKPIVVYGKVLEKGNTHNHGQKYVKMNVSNRVEFDENGKTKDLSPETNETYYITDPIYNQIELNQLYTFVDIAGELKYSYTPAK